jgi:FKBP-type peptidyl-prolyl cis-trans isomerase FkpA
MRISSRAPLLALVSIALASSCRAATQEAPAALQTEDQKTFYALGLMMGRNLTVFGLSPAELDLVKRGLSDSVTGKKPEVDFQAYFPKIQELHRTRQTAKVEAEKKKSEAYLETAAKEPGAVKTPSGLVYIPIKPGEGASPTATDKVKVHYKGTLIDGTEFDSSLKRGQPAEFGLSAGLIPCWNEGVPKMKVGEKAKLVCPSSIGYGDQGQGAIPGGATLVFEVELLEIVKK